MGKPALQNMKIQTGAPHAHPSHILQGIMGPCGHGVACLWLKSGKQKTWTTHEGTILQLKAK